MTGAHLLVSRPPPQKLVSSKLFSVCLPSFLMLPDCSTKILTELQGQDSTAVIGEMRDSLIDNWA